MLQVGITGGIGSGKTTLARYFQENYQIPLYQADLRAKYLMQQNPSLRSAISELLGPQAYLEPQGDLNRPYIAKLIFAQPELKTKLEALVHPKVAQDYQTWLTEQVSSPYVLKEAALLFETGSYQDLDLVILVTAPQELRLQRVMSRDGASREAVLARMAAQWPEAQKQALAQICLENIDLNQALAQVHTLHQELLKAAGH